MEYQLRIERVNKRLRAFGLQPERFAFKNLLDVSELPTAEQIALTLSENGMLDAQADKADEIAQALLNALNAPNLVPARLIPAPVRRYDEFQQKLTSCPSGQHHFGAYETLGTRYGAICSTTIWFSPDHKAQHAMVCIGET